MNYVVDTALNLPLPRWSNQLSYVHREKVDQQISHILLGTTWPSFLKCLILFDTEVDFVPC